MCPGAIIRGGKLRTLLDIEIFIIDFPASQVNYNASLEELIKMSFSAVFFGIKHLNYNSSYRVFCVGS